MQVDRRAAGQLEDLADAEADRYITRFRAERYTPER